MFLYKPLTFSIPFVFSFPDETLLVQAVPESAAVFPSHYSFRLRTCQRGKAQPARDFGKETSLVCEARRSKKVLSGTDCHQGIATALFSLFVVSIGAVNFLILLSDDLYSFVARGR